MCHVPGSSCPVCRWHCWVKAICCTAMTCYASFMFKSVLTEEKIASAVFSLYNMYASTAERVMDKCALLVQRFDGRTQASLGTNYRVCCFVGAHQQPPLMVHSTVWCIDDGLECSFMMLTTLHCKARTDC